MDKFDIRPYEGIGILTFGMTRQEVAGDLGSEDLLLEDADSGTLIEYREENALQLAYDLKTKLLVTISVYAPLGPVHLNDSRLDWEQSKTFYSMLKKGDPAARQIAGVSIFFRFGISTAGLVSGDQGDKSLTVFSSNTWRQSDPRLKPLT